MNKELVEQFRNYKFSIWDDEFDVQFDFTIKDLVTENIPFCGQEHISSEEERRALIEALILDLTELKNEQE